MKQRPKCGICFKYAKTKNVINGQKGEVEFICKEHGKITSCVEFEKSK